MVQIMNADSPLGIMEAAVTKTARHAGRRAASGRAVKAVAMRTPTVT